MWGTVLYFRLKDTRQKAKDKTLRSDHMLPPNVYGCETWTLSDKITRQINGANSHMLTHITGLTIPQEARPLTTSYDLISKIRQCRYKWLGHILILRSGTNRLTYQALEVQLKMQGHKDNLLMDAPPFTDLQDLTRQTQDRATWRDRSP